MKINSTKLKIAAFLAIPMIGLGVGISSPLTNQVFAADTSGLTQGAGTAKGDNTPDNLFTGNNAVFKNIANAFLFVLGAVSVLMLIYGGIRYTISGGDQSSVTAAKNTIIYAIVGVIVAIMAYAIVNWVIDQFAVKKPASSIIERSKIL
jgi:hypothetical protein